MYRRLARGAGTRVSELAMICQFTLGLCLAASPCGAPAPAPENVVLVGGQSTAAEPVNDFESAPARLVDDAAAALRRVVHIVAPPAAPNHD